MAKPFLTYEQQIVKLRDEKGLVVSDEPFASENLKRISYFALICGYKDLFKDPHTHQYMLGTTFENIVELYNFDEDLREIILKYLFQIERHLRSLISYYFSEEYGENQAAYLDVYSYEYSKRPKAVQMLVQKLQGIVTEKGKYGYINHHSERHKNVPLWVLSGALTFGTISKMYSLLPQSLCSKISKNFSVIREDDLKSILNVLTSFRNVCAHNERLFSYKTKSAAVPNLPAYQQLQINLSDSTCPNRKKDLFSVVVSMKYLLTDTEFQMLKSKLTLLLANFSRRTPIRDIELLQHMGFPNNWQDL